MILFGSKGIFRLLSSIFLKSLSLCFVLLFFFGEQEAFGGPCPDGQLMVNDLVGRYSGGPELVRRCAVPCSEGQEYVKGVCQPKCDENQERVGFVCKKKCTGDRVYSKETGQHVCLSECRVGEERIQNQHGQYECVSECRVGEERIQNQHGQYECVPECEATQSRNTAGQCVNRKDCSSGNCSSLCEDVWINDNINKHPGRLTDEGVCIPIKKTEQCNVEEDKECTLVRASNRCDRLGGHLEKPDREAKQVDEDEVAESGQEVDNGKYVLRFFQKCKVRRESAEECCSDPRKCLVFDVRGTLGKNGVSDAINATIDGSMQVLPMVPALHGVLRTISINSSGLSLAEAEEKYCRAMNQVVAGSIGSGLLTTLYEVNRKTCGEGIKKCKEECEHSIGDFIEDFDQCFNEDLLGFNKMKDVDEFVKKYQGTDPTSTPTPTCFRLNVVSSSDQGQPSGIEPEKLDWTALKNQFANSSWDDVRSNADLKKIYCGLSEDADEKFIQFRTLVYMNLLIKAFKRSTDVEGQIEFNHDVNEKKVVNCAGAGVDRVLTERKNPAQFMPDMTAMPQWMEGLCRSYVAATLNKDPDPNSPTPIAFDNPPASLMAGNVRNAPVRKNDDDDSPEGIVDDGDNDDDFGPDGRPYPNFASGGGSGSSASPPVGGAPPGGGGNNMAGNSSGNKQPVGGGFRYPSMGGGLGAGGFENSGGGFPYSSGSDAPYPYQGDRTVAGNSNTGGSGYPDGSYPPGYPGDPHTSGETIFEIASQRIKVFCSDHSCID